MNEQRVKIAIQKSGRLSDATMDLLKRCGLKNNQPKDKLITHIKNMPIDILRVRDDDIPGLVMEGVVDLGFVGDNTVQEVQLKREKMGKLAEYEELIRLDYGQCQLSIAVPEERKYAGVADLQGTRIATSYPYLLTQFLEKQGVTAQIVHLKGAVEVAPRANLSDAICDLVSSGVTLEANGLREVDVMFKSTAVLIQRVGIPHGNIKSIIEMLIPRINSVMQAKESKYIMMHAPLEQLEDIIKLLPGAEKPTVLPLAGVKDQVAIHAVSSETVFWETMESLKKLGASSILILPIEKMMA